MLVRISHLPCRSIGIDSRWKERSPSSREKWKRKKSSLAVSYPLSLTSQRSPPPFLGIQHQSPTYFVPRRQCFHCRPSCSTCNKSLSFSLAAPTVSAYAKEHKCRVALRLPSVRLLDVYIPRSSRINYVVDCQWIRRFSQCPATMS